MIAFYSYPEKDKMLAKHKIMLHEMYDAINVYDMNVMNAHVSWWAVLLGIDES